MKYQLKSSVLCSKERLLASRFEWLKEYIACGCDEEYVKQFSKKILLGFLETGVIPKSRQAYFSVAVAYEENNQFRKYLREELGIKFRSFWVGGCLEYLIKKEDYNFMKLTSEFERNRFYKTQDNDVDIDIGLLFEKYQKWAEKYEV